MEYQSFNAIYPRMKLEYDIEMQPTDFEELALIGWDRIGNKRYRMYHSVQELIPTDDGQYMVELPCNCNILEAVTLDWGENWMYTTNLHLNGDWNSHYVENYIEGRKMHKSPFYAQGIYAKYVRAEDKLYFRENYGRVHILYKGILVDDEGLPNVTEKEIEAIAAFIAYIQKQKAAWRINDINSLRMSELAKNEWNRLCSQARIPEHITQNEMDRILDAKTSYNRKHFGWSAKPVK